MLPTVFTGCVSLARIAIFLLARSVEQAPQDDRDSGNQSFAQPNSRADVLFVADRFFLESLLRSVRKPSTTKSRQPSWRHSGEITHHGPPLVLSNRGQNAQTGHCWFVDNIGIVSAQFSQVHVTLDESKQDFEKDRLMLHVIFVRSDSGRALGFELHVTLRIVGRCGRIRNGLRCFLKRRRVAGWELEGLMGHVTFLGLLRRETLSLFHSVCRFARNFYHQREPLWISARAELEAFCRNHDLDRGRLSHQ